MKMLSKPRLTFGLILLCLSALLLFYFFFSSQKISYVDSGKLMTGYKAMVEARSAFEKKRQTWQSNVDSLTQEVQNAISSYEKILAAGTENEKKLSRELITTRQKQLYDYQAAVAQNSDQEEQRLTQPVLSTINAYLLRYGKKYGYKLILVATNGNIAYADPSMDITDIIVENLNKEYSHPSKP
ncbi:MAG: OmpH family outer membrane protein [Chitinophagaceae bacterium]|nr:OmpH family outer membrane protein [Chitinophagaceae bacterium]